MCLNSIVGNRYHGRMERILGTPLQRLSLHRLITTIAFTISILWSLPFSLLFGLNLHAQGPLSVSHSSLVLDPPEVRSPFVLRAINDPDTGKAAFSFEGQEDPP